MVTNITMTTMKTDSDVHTGMTALETDYKYRVCNVLRTRQLNQQGFSRRCSNLRILCNFKPRRGTPYIWMIGMIVVFFRGCNRRFSIF